MSAQPLSIAEQLTTFHDEQRKALLVQRRAALLLLLDRIAPGRRKLVDANKLAFLRDVIIHDLIICPDATSGAAWQTCLDALGAYWCLMLEDRSPDMTHALECDLDDDCTCLIAEQGR